MPAIRRRRTGPEGSAQHAGSSWEAALNGLIIRDNAIREVVDAGVREDWFGDEWERDIFRLCLRHWQEHGQAPSARKVKADHPTYRVLDTEDPLTSVLVDAVESRKTYLLSKALYEATAVLDDGYPDDAAAIFRAAQHQLDQELRRGDESLAGLAPQRTRWLWNQYIHLGTLSALTGDGDRGKSTVALDIAARVTQGTLEGDLKGTPRNVLISTTEDHLAATVVPRLIAAGADLNRVFNLAVVRPLTFPQDAALLERKIAAYDAALVILDPFLGHFGSHDSHKESDVRKTLTPLERIAEEARCAILGLHHWNKSSGRAAIRMTGSSAWRNVMRSVLICEEDPDCPGQYVLAVEKFNLASRRPPSQGYMIVSAPAGVDIEDGEAITAGAVRWLGERDISARELVAGRADDAPSAMTFLQRALEAGPVATAEVETHAEEQGLTQATLKRARRELAVQSRRHRSHWDLALAGTSLTATCDDNAE
jgi:hypothetical protein